MLVFLLHKLHYNVHIMLKLITQVLSNVRFGVNGLEGKQFCM